MQAYMTYIKICVCTCNIYINAVSNGVGPLKKIILKDSGVMRSIEVSKTKAVGCDGEPGMEVREIRCLDGCGKELRFFLSF